MKFSLITKTVLTAALFLTAGAPAQARQTVYLVKDNHVVGKHYTDDIDYMTYSLPEGVTDNLPDPERGATLILGGSDKVMVVNTLGLADGCDATPFIRKEWNAATLGSALGLNVDRMDHIDDCKPTADGHILVTSSYGWTAMLDSDLTPVFYTKGTDNAHSAEMVDGRWIAVACSTGGDEIRLYDSQRNGLLKFRTELKSAHGVVWMPSTRRLYAIGGQTLNIYSLSYRTRPDGTPSPTAPELVLEKSITTPQGGLHDLTPVDDRTLCVSGRKSRLFDIDTETFTELPLFDKSTGLKSVNYNRERNEVWYTDSTVPEGDYSWSTHTVRFSDDPAGSAPTFTFRIPGVNLYKVRVLDWGH